MPLAATIRDFNDTVKTIKTIDVAITRRWKTPNHSVPRLYGLPKVYKEGELKIRPINVGITNGNYMDFKRQIRHTV